jgi:UDP-2,3-diacylglucosamine pyrophosphatase LpxH
MFDFDYSKHFHSGYLQKSEVVADEFTRQVLEKISFPDFSDTFGKPVSVFDTIILSDLHLGSKVSRAEDLLQFLQGVNFKRLIINGDIFDSINMKRLNRHHWRILSYLRELTDKENETEVIWLRGNHDGYADLISQLLGIEFLNEYLLEWNGKRVLIFHGDIFDKFITRYPLLADIADLVYRSILYMDLPDKKIGRWLKRNSKTFIRNSELVREGAISYARHKNAQIVVCGHTHLVEEFEHNGIRYLNPGSWTDTPAHFVGLTEDQAQVATFR